MITKANMNRYGVFINHRYHNRYFAGRVYDYLKNKGLDPFLDIYGLGQGDFNEELENTIRETPYFLAVLGKGDLDDLDPDSGKDVYYKEWETAIESKRNILLVAEAGFQWPYNLPPKMRFLQSRHFYEIDRRMSNFFEIMDLLRQKDIDLSLLDGILNWREYVQYNANVLLIPREEMEKKVSTLENRFGHEFIECVKEKRSFEGRQRVRHINMACYAASIVFAPDRDLVDHKAYDRGLMNRIFATLLEDEEFALNIIINSPDSPGAQDAVKREKLGNSSLEDDTRKVFLGSYYNMRQLLQEEPYKSANNKKRFKYYLTDTVIPFAYFQMEYKEPWAAFDHIKLDLYTEGIDSNMQRGCMIIFKQDNPELYTYFYNHYTHLKSHAMKETKTIEHNKGQDWIQEWKEC